MSMCACTATGRRLRSRNRSDVAALIRRATIDRRCYCAVACRLRRVLNILLTAHFDGWADRDEFAIAHRLTNTGDDGGGSECCTHLASPCQRRAGDAGLRD